MGLRPLASLAGIACRTGTLPMLTDDPPASAGVTPNGTASAQERSDDFADQLPRVAPKEPDAALATFQLRPGFRIERVASEPLIRDPVAIDFDENGRMFVLEFPEYNSQYAEEPVERRGAVKMLEDTNGDGQYDQATTYVDDLQRPAAVACYGGGIFVGVAPEIRYCKDTDGDGRADIREVGIQ